MFARYLPPEYSGAASQALLLAQHLRNRGHRIEMVSPAWGGHPHSYQLDGFRVTRVHISLDAVHKEFSVWRALSAYLWRRRHQIDILHGQGAYYTQSIIGPLGRLFRKPSLVKASLWNDDLCSLTDSNIAPVHRRFLGMVDAYVAISRDLEQEFVAKGLIAEKVRRIPNGVDIERFHPRDADAKAAAATALGLPTDRPISLFVGVFDQRKRISWLAEHWVESNGFGTGGLLVAVGPTSRETYGPALRRGLERLAAAHPERLRVHELTQDIAPFYRASDQLILPSSNEGLPNAVLEAMACGLPTVACRVSGSSELVRDDITGATFTLDDPQGLAVALAAVGGDRGRRLGEEARRIVTRDYSIEGVAAKYEELYRELYAQRQGAGMVKGREKR